MATQVDFNMTAYSTLRDVTSFSSDNWIVGIGLLCFFIGLLFFRYKAIVSPSIERLNIEIRTLDAKISAYPEAFKKSETAEEQRQILTKIKEKTQKLLWYDKWFISGGEVIAGWRLLHEAKISNMERYEIDRIIDELYIFHSRLVELERSDAKAIAREMGNALEQFEKTEIITTVKEIKETLKKLEKTDNKNIIEEIHKR
jgi:chaperonin cofactor prefoldin